MVLKTQAWAALGSTLLFVLLWSSGGIFTSWGLAHASLSALLVMRFTLAFIAILAIAIRRKRVLPAPGTRRLVAGAGVLMIGSYSISYFLAMSHGVNPGVLGVVLGAQPILTLMLLEKMSARRIAGLTLALAGLVLVLAGSLADANVRGWGTVCAIVALASITFGAIVQKRVRQSPFDVLPMQYGIALAMCMACLPFQPFVFGMSVSAIVPVLWLGLVISVGAQLLLYRMIQQGNLVNVTSLFYLVPVVTALLDYLLLGHTLTASALAGMAAVLAGLALVFVRI